MSVIDGKAVRRARRNLGIAQKELARMAGIGRSTVYAIEQCCYERKPWACTVERVASALGVDAGEILVDGSAPTARGGGRLARDRPTFVAEEFVDAIECTGFDTSKASAAAGIREDRINAFIRGDAAPSPHEMTALSRGLGISYSDMMGYPLDMPDDEISALENAFDALTWQGSRAPALPQAR
ncbi:MAG TPA: helix-turn-helix domain-containing protein [Slackia equolifaciens]|uniref:Helix-turn-helix domain-containing protein n=1 Tax=Slackia equolifaciens TaxID=498718 RepID=A0A9D2UWE8_9ACTN|nr:helix-turn-helix domain-containing protein [Slackia equolifaciens]